jgi:hypothetical protein
VNTLKTLRVTFKTRAVIDWIELTVTLKKPSQFRYVQRALQTILQTDAITFVRAQDKGPGGSTTQFVFRLHDHHAAKLSELERIMSELALVHPFAAQPEVSGIEIALDFYNRCEPGNVLDLVHRLQLSVAARGNIRQFDPDKAPNPKYGNRFLNSDRPEPVTGLIIDPRLNLRIGDKGDTVQWQIYDKRTDHNRQPIDQSQRRARAEFTLNRDELAKRVFGPDAGSRTVTLGDLRLFRFETLARLLHFRKFKPIERVTDNPVVALALDSQSSLRKYGIANYRQGLVTAYQDKRRPTEVARMGERKFSKDTVADAELNAIVRRKLEALTGTFA